MDSSALARVRTGTVQSACSLLCRWTSQARQQELLQLRFAAGLRCPQIAIRMGKREGAVRIMLVRTLQKLRGMYHANREEQS
ncbi:MAG TPA: sigma factor-like helix-turn-helix DNA-binding protein [Ktedonobacteraceae bacterium]